MRWPEYVRFRDVRKEIVLATTPVEVKRTPPAPANTLDAWRSLRTEIDRLFDGFDGGWDMPSTRRMFDVEPTLYNDSIFRVLPPAVDITEDDAAYRVTAELPGMNDNEIEVLVSGDTLTLKGEKQEEREQKDQNLYTGTCLHGRWKWRNHWSICLI
jgi:HSP20 family protein